MKDPLAVPSLSFFVWTIGVAVVSALCIAALLVLCATPAPAATHRSTGTRVHWRTNASVPLTRFYPTEIYHFKMPHRKTIIERFRQGDFPRIPRRPHHGYTHSETYYTY